MRGNIDQTQVLRDVRPSAKSTNSATMEAALSDASGPAWEGRGEEEASAPRPEAGVNSPEKGGTAALPL